MTQINDANANRNSDLFPRAYRLLIDRNLAPQTAAMIAGDPLACRRVLGALNPERVACRPAARRRL